MPGWSVVMTKPNCENIAVAHLTRQGFNCYAPRFRETRPDKTVLIKPLFPRYIFTLIDSFWYCIRGTRGVSYLLMGDNGPAQVAPAVISRIQSNEDDEGFIVLKPKIGMTERFHKGDHVKATEGPFTDQVLVYEGTTGKDRVKVLMSMLGRQVPVTVKEQSLVAA